MVFAAAVLAIVAVTHLYLWQRLAHATTTRGSRWRPTAASRSWDGQ